MARQPKKKGPGSGRPGIPRKYAKPGQQPTSRKPKKVEDQTLTPTQAVTHQDPAEPEIDFSAPLANLPEDPKSPLIDNNIYIYNKDDINNEVVIERENKTKIKANNHPNNQQNVKDDVVLIPEIVDDSETIESFNLKSQLTLKEFKFIELLLSGDYKIEKAMIEAGYTGYNKDYLYRLSRKIVQKYELQAGDHRKIMRAMGYGEVKVIGMMIEAATKFKSETVKQKARETLGRWLGLSDIALEGAEGVQIIIKTTSKPGPQPQTPGQGPPGALPQPAQKTRMIK